MPDTFTQDALLAEITGQAALLRLCHLSAADVPRAWNAIWATLGAQLRACKPSTANTSGDKSPPTDVRLVVKDFGCFVVQYDAQGINPTLPYLTFLPSEAFLQRYGLESRGVRAWRPPGTLRPVAFLYREAAYQVGIAKEDMVMFVKYALSTVGEHMHNGEHVELVLGDIGLLDCRRNNISFYWAMERNSGGGDGHNDVASGGGGGLAGLPANNAILNATLNRSIPRDRVQAVLRGEPGALSSRTLGTNVDDAIDVASSARRGGLGRRVASPGREQSEPRGRHQHGAGGHRAFLDNKPPLGPMQAPPTPAGASSAHHRHHHHHKLSQSPQQQAKPLSAEQNGGQHVQQDVDGEAGPVSRVEEWAKAEEARMASLRCGAKGDGATADGSSVRYSVGGASQRSARSSSVLAQKHLEDERKKQQRSPAAGLGAAAVPMLRGTPVPFENPKFAEAKQRRAKIKEESRAMADYLTAKLASTDMALTGGSPSLYAPGGQRHLRAQGQLANGRESANQQCGDRAGSPTRSQASSQLSRGLMTICTTVDPESTFRQPPQKAVQQAMDLAYQRHLDKLNAQQQHDDNVFAALEVKDQLALRLVEEEKKKQKEVSEATVAALNKQLEEHKTNKGRLAVIHDHPVDVFSAANVNPIGEVEEGIKEKNKATKRATFEALTQQVADQKEQAKLRKEWQFAEDEKFLTQLREDVEKAKMNENRRKVEVKAALNAAWDMQIGIAKEKL